MDKDEYKPHEIEYFAHRSRFFDFRLFQPAPDPTNPGRFDDVVVHFLSGNELSIECLFEDHGDHLAS